MRFRLPRDRIWRRTPVLLLVILASLPALALASDGLSSVPAEAAVYGLGGASLVQLVLSLLVGSRQVEATSSVHRLSADVTAVTAALASTREEIARTYITRADWTAREQTTATKAEAQALAAQAARLEAETHSQRERLAEAAGRLQVLEERISHVSRVVDDMDAAVGTIRQQNTEILSLLRGDGHGRR